MYIFDVLSKWHIHREGQRDVSQISGWGTVMQKSPNFWHKSAGKSCQHWQSYWHLTSNSCDKWQWKTLDRWYSTATKLAPRMHQHLPVHSATADVSGAGEADW